MAQSQESQGSAGGGAGGVTSVATLIDGAASGSRESAGALLEQVYTQLRAVAQMRLAGERTGHSLQATELVHEAYLRLLGGTGIEWAGRAHFFHAAAEAMRRILIEHARKRGRVKRGGEMRRVPLSVLDLTEDHDPEEVIALDEAVGRLEAEDARVAEVVRLRFFAGLSVEATAAVLGTSERTVKREWQFARAWLFREMEGRAAAPM